ncbi:MAG: FadR/GntR family transcriptional regulator [Sphingomonas oligoaromativorans]|jgi:GntR family transcriptional repressor for pyruvate dehydrogenase complex|uniref:FadR/GntR family transcriptional regulator n=1 Tax=Sphingomonas oligoaromativorans TaxID=575322 RepID=UPI0014247474|nr:FadR/GntR family transcriptional regulator [Sphingomonas oligoaromativorans]NIJ32675.1 GntR family transcriptional repressor for pyruvate dehydrogenase complex [Sphingomonas oligoaromativorans]
MPAIGQKLYQRVAAAISEAIESGQYAPGARLPGERDLAEEFSVSRPTIREAMIALEIRGLVEARHGSGLYVTNTAPAEVAALELDIGAFELTEARILFEGETAALAATVMTEEKLARLETLMREMSGPNPDMRTEQADRRFHVEIAACTDNSAIRGVIEMLWDLRYRSPLCVHMFAKAARSGINPRIDEHRAILDALKSGDAHAARAAMHSHLRRVIEDVLAATEMEAMERARTEISARRSEITRRISL